MGRFQIRHGRQAIGDFRRTWPQLLLVTLATRAAVTLILLPVPAVLLRFFISRQGRSALSDQEILFFLLSPWGLVALVVAGGIWVGISFVEQAGLMVVGFGAAEERRVTWFGALRYVIAELPRILTLGSHLLIRATLLAAPVIAIMGGVYWAFLRHHDINYYLLNRPPEFVWAAGIAGALAVILAALLTVKLLSWLLALPAVLFENLKPTAAIRDSVADSRGHRWTILAWILLWLAAAAAASTMITWSIGLLGRAAIPLTRADITWVALAMGTVGLLSLAANAILSFLSAALLALLVTRLYREFSGPGALSRDLAREGSLGARPAVRVPRKGLLAIGAVAAAAAIIIAGTLLGSVRLEDDTTIVAHRGAMMHAPENTLAAMRRAIADSADYLEIDVQESADGEVVVFHDSDFMKTARNPLNIWNATRADLDAIDVGSWFDPAFSGERVPTLEEVLLEAKGRARVNIELKYYGRDVELERRVVEAVERTGMSDQVVVMSLKYDKVQKIRAIRPDWTYGLLTTVNLGDATRFDVDFLAVNAVAATRAFVDRAHRAGREVYVWTVNDPYLMSALMSRDVDGIITDDPGLAREVLRVRAGLDPVQRLLLGIGAEIGVFSMPDDEQETEAEDA